MPTLSIRPVISPRLCSSEHMYEQVSYSSFDQVRVQVIYRITMHAKSIAIPTGFLQVSELLCSHSREIHFLPN